jgi:hypothetical protein
MKDKEILVITDGSKDIDYKRVLRFCNKKLIQYPVFHFNEIQHEKINLILIDLEDEIPAIGLAIKFRSICKSCNIVFVVDLSYQNENDFFVKSRGHGLTKVFGWKGNNEKKLYELVTSMNSSSCLNQKMGEVMIVLPVFNEANRFKNVRFFYQDLKTLAEDTKLNISVNFINDGSNDNTAELLKNLSDEELEKDMTIRNKPFVQNKDLPINTRKAGTYIDALKNIDADYYVFVDADNSFYIRDITRMLNILDFGYYDMVVGTKDYSAQNRSLKRRWLSFAKRTVTKIFLPKGIYDSQTGLKAMTRLAGEKVLNNLNIKSGLAIDLEMLYVAKRKNLRVLQLPVDCFDQEGSHVNIIKDSVWFLKILSRLAFDFKGKRI